MLARRFALGFGIAIILPLMVHYGVSTFTSRPKWGDYEINNYYNRYNEASPTEKKILEEEREQQQKQYEDARQFFQRNLFFTAVPIGIVTIIIGSMSAIPGVGAGLMFGGIFTLVDGYCWYWTKLQDWMIFLSLLVAFIILIFIGYRKLSMQKSK